MPLRARSFFRGTSTAASRLGCSSPESSSGRSVICSVFVGITKQEFTQCANIGVVNWGCVGSLLMLPVDLRLTDAVGETEGLDAIEIGGSQLYRISNASFRPGPVGFGRMLVRPPGPPKNITTRCGTLPA